MKSDAYRDLLPMLNSGRISLLDNARLVGQLCALERRTARGGKDTIDHPRGAHDDLINAVALAATLARKNVGILINPTVLAAPDRYARQLALAARLRAGGAVGDVPTAWI